ncbi:zinc-ribbon domain-containing protein, partial [Catenibacterium sp.]
MKCPHCHKDIRPTDHFCPHCGYDLRRNPPRST